jgi:hypothetical protein
MFTLSRINDLRMVLDSPSSLAILIDRLKQILVVSIFCLVSLGMMNEPLKGCYHRPCTV